METEENPDVSLEKADIEERESSVEGERVSSEFAAMVSSRILSRDCLAYFFISSPLLIASLELQLSLLINLVASYSRPASSSSSLGLEDESLAEIFCGRSCLSLPDRFAFGRCSG